MYNRRRARVEPTRRHRKFDASLTSLCNHVIALYVIEKPFDIRYFGGFLNVRYSPTLTVTL